MVSEHGWDYNTFSGPPQNWDHGKDAQSYYYITDWLKFIHSSGIAIGTAELEAGAILETPAAMVATATADWDVEPIDVTTAPNNEAFEIMGHEEEVKKAKKDPGGWDAKPAPEAGDGWLVEDTAPGIVEDGRIWRGVKRFRVPVLKEIKISDEPSVAGSNWVEPAPGSRGGYRGWRSGGGGYRGWGRGRGRGRGRGKETYQGNWAGVSDWSKNGGSNRGTRGAITSGNMW